jgi:hyperosmotically inducible protein
MAGDYSTGPPAINGPPLAPSHQRGDPQMRGAVPIAILIVALALTAGCRSMTGESVGQNIDDTTITTEVKAKLTGERASNLTRVSVATANGNVSLTGIVPTVADKARAEELARSVKGVQRVTNNLQVEKP